MDDQDILNLKAEGRSLREIASVLGISHEAVRKKLKDLRSKDQMSTKARGQELTVSTKEKEKVSTGSNADKSRASGQGKHTVNQVSTKETPSHTLTEGVNPLGTPSDKHPGCMKGVYQGVDSKSGDLLKEIKEFLEAEGVEVYRMNVKPEGYQVKVLCIA